jgi:hypothetical protein
LKNNHKDVVLLDDKRTEDEEKPNKLRELRTNNHNKCKKSRNKMIFHNQKFNRRKK